MWEPFHFESNQVWGLCDSQEKWDEIKSIYLEEHRTMDLNEVKINTYADVDVVKSGERNWSFGTRIEFDGDYSLADFAKEYNMEL